MYEADPSVESENGKSVLTAHYFRHNYASFLYNADVDILWDNKKARSIGGPSQVFYELFNRGIFIGGDVV
jgi:hypothetical protein